MSELSQRNQGSATREAGESSPNEEPINNRNAQSPNEFTFLECMKHFHPLEDPLDCLNLMAIILLAIGLISTVSACLAPRDMPELEDYPSARIAEKAQKEYADRIEWWDYVLLVGMFFVAAGGVLTTLLMVYGWINTTDNTKKAANKKANIDMYEPKILTKSYGTMQ